MDGAKWLRCTSTRSPTMGLSQEVSFWAPRRTRSGAHFRIDHALSKWSSSFLEAMHPRKNPRAPMQLGTWMTHAGFKDVESKLLTLPMCGWSKGQYLGAKSCPGRLKTALQNHETRLLATTTQITSTSSCTPLLSIH